MILRTDLTKRRFNVDIMMLYSSGSYPTRKLKFNIYVHLPSMNKIFQYFNTVTLEWFWEGKERLLFLSTGAIF